MVNYRILNYKSSKANKSLEGIRNARPFASSTEVGLVFTIEDQSKHNSVKKFIQKLEASGKKVQALCYLPKGANNHEFLFDFFEKNEVNFWGVYKNEKVEQFVHQSYDFLYVLDKEIGPLIANIIARSHAKCRIGCSNSKNEEYLEFMIKSKTHNYDEIFDDFYNYSEKIK